MSLVYHTNFPWHNPLITEHEAETDYDLISVKSSPVSRLMSIVQGLLWARTPPPPSFHVINNFKCSLIFSSRPSDANSDYYSQCSVYYSSVSDFEKRFITKCILKCNPRLLLESPLEMNWGQSIIWKDLFFSQKKHTFQDCRGLRRTAGCRKKLTTLWLFFAALVGAGACLKHSIWVWTFSQGGEWNVHVSFLRRIMGWSRPDSSSERDPSQESEVWVGQAGVREEIDHQNIFRKQER